MATTTTIADEIYTELGSPSSTSAAAIKIWLDQNVGQLNNSLGTSYVISSAVFTPDINAQSIYCYKLLYSIYYNNLQINTVLGAAGNYALEVDSDGGRVKLVNRLDFIKAYRDWNKELLQALKDLRNYYRSDNASVATVRSEDGFYTPIPSRPSFNNTRGES